MKNPWTDDGAFDDMFQDTVEIRGKNKSGIQRSSVPACVFPLDDVQPFSEIDSENDVKLIDVAVKIRDWPFMEKPQTGYTLTTADGMQWKVSDVQRESSWYKLRARSYK